VYATSRLPFLAPHGCPQHCPPLDPGRLRQPWVLAQMLERRGNQAGLPDLHPTSYVIRSPMLGSRKVAARPI